MQTNHSKAERGARDTERNRERGGESEMERECARGGREIAIDRARNRDTEM